MEQPTSTKITVETTVNASIEKAWTYWSEPKHITQWYFAADTWHAPYAENNLCTGGSFKTTMAAKDGSFGFDFEGIYTNVELHRCIEYRLADNRMVSIIFSGNQDSTHISESFDAEKENPVEMQKTGWQAILNNFKIYIESNS